MVDIIFKKNINLKKNLTKKNLIYIFLMRIN